jgi:hypothetical protein
MSLRIIFTTLLFIPLVVSAWGVEIPISLISKNSIIGKGKVIVITNTSDEYLHECPISINNNNAITLATLKPHESQNIGWMELGYELRIGDNISVSCKKYLIPVSIFIK